MSAGRAKRKPAGPWSPPAGPDIDRSIADLIREARMVEAMIDVDDIVYPDDTIERGRASWNRVAAIWEELARRDVTNLKEATDLLEFVASRIFADLALQNGFSDEIEHAGHIIRSVNSYLIVMQQPPGVAEGMADLADRNREARRLMAADAG